MNDPYPEPFEWCADYEAPIPMLYGMLPCLCEQGFMPLLNGDAIECPLCSTRRSE